MDYYHLTKPVPSGYNDPEPWTFCDVFLLASLAGLVGACLVGMFLIWLGEMVIGTVSQVIMLSNKVHHWIGNPRINRNMGTAVSIMIMAGLVLVGYSWASVDCALHQECTWASAHWANFVFGK